MNIKSYLSRRSFIRTSALASGAALILTPEGCQSEGKSESHNVKENLDNKRDHDVGAIFAKGNKSYFPMMLGNGIDNVLIGYSGAMGACQAHEAWNYGNMNMETVTGWYRSDIRKRPPLDVLNLLQCGYIVRRGIHADGIEYSEQEFDGRKGILITRCSLGYADIQVTTFLTRDHILVHRFYVMTHDEDMTMQFFIKSANPSPLNVTIKAEEHSDSLMHEHLDFMVKGENWPDTPGRLFCDHSQVSRVTCYNRQTGLEVTLSDKSEFTFAVQCSLVEDVIKGMPLEPLRDNFDYGATFQRHCSEWESFNSPSSINLKHDDIEDIYNTSLYTVRAHQHPVLGGITVGSYPGMWGNSVYPSDMSFSIMGLLGANRMKEAELGVQFWKRSLSSFAKLLREVGIPHGVFVPCDLSVSGEASSMPHAYSREKILEQKHIEPINLSLQTWYLYQYSGRISVLNEYWDVLMEPLKFVMEYCVNEFDNHAEIIRSSGPNGKERVDGKIVYYPNPTNSLLATIEALRGACKAADLLGREIDSHWPQLLRKLEHGIEVNRFDGVLRNARTPKASVAGMASQIGLFNVLTVTQDLINQIEMSSSREGYLTWTNHGYRAVPWKMCDVSAACSRKGIEGAARYLEMAAKFTTTLYGFPEAIRPDGVYVKTWYPTVHGDFIHAVNLMLVQRRDELVELFAGVPDEWGDVSFKSIRVPVGLLVSASRTREEITVKIINDSDHYQEFKVRTYGKYSWDEDLALNPGETFSMAHRK